MTSPRGWGFSQHGCLGVVGLPQWFRTPTRVFQQNCQELHSLSQPSLRSSMVSLPPYATAQSSHKPTQIQREGTETPLPARRRTRKFAAIVFKIMTRLIEVRQLGRGPSEELTFEESLDEVREQSRGRVFWGRKQKCQTRGENEAGR